MSLVNSCRWCRSEPSLTRFGDRGPPADRAVRFASDVRQWTSSDAGSSLVAMADLKPDVPRPAPTPEHCLPLSYVLGAADRDEVTDFPPEGIEAGSISMLLALPG